MVLESTVRGCVFCNSRKLYHSLLFRSPYLWENVRSLETIPLVYYQSYLKQVGEEGTGLSGYWRYWNGEKKIQNSREGMLEGSIFL